MSVSINMSINFTGINNIISETNQKISEKLGQESKSYLKNVSLTMNLNDVENKDLFEFKQALQNSTNYCRKKCLNKKQPDKLNIYCENITEIENTNKESYSTFDINGTTLLLDEDGVLPIFTYIAKLTKKISQNINLPDNDRKAAEFINNKIQEEAVRYFDMNA